MTGTRSDVSVRSVHRYAHGARVTHVAGAFLAALLVGLTTGESRAADSPTPRGDAPAPGGGPAANAPAPVEMLVAHERASMRSFYGWEILIGGEGGGALAALSILLPDRPLGTVAGTAGFIIGTPVFALGGPVVHWSHDDFTKGLVSFGANVVIPLTAGFIGRSARCSGEHGDDCEFHGFFTGFALGLVTVPIVDALVLGWENVPVEDSGASAARSRVNARRAESARFKLAPGFQLGPRGEVELGVSGQF